MTKSHHNVAIVGATGAVGKEVIDVLKKQNFPLKSLLLLTSPQSAGRVLETPFGPIACEEFSVEKARTCDVVFLCVSGDFSKRFGPEIIKNDGPFVIDNSSAFRLEQDVPLVVPEINAHHIGKARLIANPNCTTALASVVLWPLHREFGLRRVMMSTYQAASGAGAQGMDELKSGFEDYLKGQPLAHHVFSHPLACNVIPHIDAFQDNGYTREEMKVVWETRKIFDADHIQISCTAVRVPTLRAHAESIIIETEHRIDAQKARDILKKSPGVQVCDDVNENDYPMPVNSTGIDAVKVGRIRQSLIFQDQGLELFLCGDQLLKGAALNAVQIALKIFSL